MSESEPWAIVAHIRSDRAVVLVEPEAANSAVPLRRISDLLTEINLLDVQLELVQERAGLHRLTCHGQQIAALYRRLDDLEHQLRSRALRQDPGAWSLPFRQLRRRLNELTEGRSAAIASYRGPERRQADRRAGDPRAGP